MCCGNNNIIHGAIGIGKAVLGIDTISQEEINKRLDACRTCEHSTKNKDRLDRPSKGLTSLSTCNKCSCIIYFKTQLKEEVCPEGKW